MRHLIVLTFAVLMIVAALAAQSPVVMPAGKLQWGPPPASLPAGARMAVLNGDPAKPGRYAITGTFPDGYVFPPHAHPAEENIVVTHGTMLVGIGDTFNEASLIALTAGSYAFMPPATRHYARAKGETTIVVYGTGPFDVAYARSADDPRTKK
jgi:quercetin dioxygenase-like cupin family protein